MFEARPRAHNVQFNKYLGQKIYEIYPIKQELDGFLVFQILFYTEIENRPIYSLNNKINLNTTKHLNTIIVKDI